MLRMKTLLFLSLVALALAACGGPEPDGSGGSATPASTTPADTTAPSIPGNFTATAAGSTGANLSWSASTDNVGVTGYIVRRGGAQVATPTTTIYADTGLSPGQTYSYTVAARDAAGNISPNSPNQSVTTAVVPPPDTIPPSVPTNLVGTPGTNAIGLTWTASTDNVGVTGYTVRRNGTPVATSAYDLYVYSFRLRRCGEYFCANGTCAGHDAGIGDGDAACPVSGFDATWNVGRLHCGQFRSCPRGCWWRAFDFGICQSRSLGSRSQENPVLGNGPHCGSGTYHL